MTSAQELLALAVGWPLTIFLMVLAWRARRLLSGIRQQLQTVARSEVPRSAKPARSKAPRLSPGEQWRMGPQAAALHLRRSEYVLFQLGSIVLPGLLGYGVRGPLGAVLLAVVGFVGVSVYFRMKQSRWLMRCEDSLPGFLRGVASALRAGSSLTQAMLLVAHETEDPLGGEIVRVMRRERLGFNLVDILHELTDRIPSRDLELTVVAIVIQREVGGSLANLLDNIVQTIVDRQRLKREIRVLTAQGRYSGMVLIALPFLLGFAIALFNPSYMTPLFTTPTGWGMSAAAFVGVVLGGFVINRLVQSPEM